MTGVEPLTTALSAWHKAHGGRMVEFGGWLMPVQYSTIIDEHRAVRSAAGLFDIGHMGRLFFTGPDAAPWIDRATTNAVGRLAPGQIQYSLMANDDGGLLDDVLVYRLGPGGDVSFVVVCNASNREAVVARFARVRGSFNADLDDRTRGTTMIAVQGPEAVSIVGRVVEEGAGLADLGYYRCASVRVGVDEVLASRTGYTGEDGFELILPWSSAGAAWEALVSAGQEAGLRPCGLGARDTLRFEAAMPLYGHELSATINPYEAGLGWAVKLSKGEFVGRNALREAKARPGRTRIGLALDGRRIARQGCEVKHQERVVGSVTSGTFAPTLGRSLAMALVEASASEPGTRLTVDVRGQDEPAEVVPIPFYRRPTGPTS